MTKKEHTVFEEIRGTADEILSQVKKLIREGNARRLIVRNKKGKILFQSQLTAGVAGTTFVVAIAPIISTIAIFLLFVNGASVIIEREEDFEGEKNHSNPDIIDITD